MMQFDASEYGLAVSLTDAFGRSVSPEEAKTWIDKHKRAYPTLWAWKGKLQQQYKINKFLKLPDGWYVWGDNPNFRSVGNVPVQGTASCIMRKAVELAQERGLYVIYTLHDALYIEYDVGNEKAIELLAECMDEAFRFYFGHKVKHLANIRLDADIWGPSYEDNVIKWETSYTTKYGTFKLPVKQQRTYIDKRAEKDYNYFSKYFTIEDNFDNWVF